MSNYNHLSPEDGADTLGSMVNCALIQGAGYLTALRWAKEALDGGDVERAKLVLNNALVGTEGSPPPSTIENPSALLYACLPRHGETPGFG